jgi:hypothetical protein
LAVVWLWPDEVVVAILIVTLFGLLIVPIWAGVRRAELSSSAVQKETLSVRAAAMFRFTIRELALLTLVVGLGLGCWLMWAHVGSEQRRWN